jgi:hypothetical protein
MLDAWGWSPLGAVATEPSVDLPQSEGADGD